MTRKNYVSYKDGLPIIELSPSKLRSINGKICVKTFYSNGSGRTHVRIRLRPVRRLSLTQENALLRRQLARYTKQEVNK